LGLDLPNAPKIVPNVVEKNGLKNTKVVDNQAPLSPN